MLRYALILWVCLLGATPVQAQWALASDAVSGNHAASVCPVDKADALLCFEVSCQAGGALGYWLRTENRPKFDGVSSFRAMVQIGSRAPKPLMFEAREAGMYFAPLEEADIDGLDALMAGARAQLRLWLQQDRPPEIVRLGLTGSRVSISAVMEACPLPDFSARAQIRKTKVDPASEILGALQEGCAALDGTLSVEDGFAVPIDMDGVVPMDLQIDHDKAVCSASKSLVCSRAGCVQSLWLGLPDNGGYREVFQGEVRGIDIPEPGKLTLSVWGRECGKSANATCEQVFAVADGQLMAME